VLANKPESNDSLNPYVFIIDEMHAHPTLDFFNVMKSGIMSRENPLGIITSTAGFNRDYPFFKMIETAKKVLEGVIDDDITFYALYTLDDDDDVEDYDSWVKANPNVGQTIRLDALKKEYVKAKLMPTELMNFITKNLNRYVDPLDQWIPDDQYKKNQQQILPPKGERLPAFVGIDLSAVRDIASMVLSFTDPISGKLVSIPEFYFPQNEVKKIRESGIDLAQWINEGWIIEHESKTIDQEKIYERVEYWHTIFDIKLIFYDKWNSAFLIPKIEQNMFIECRHFQQTTTWFNFPLKYIEKLFFSEELAIGKNPVMRWMYHNIVLYVDGNGNIKIMKNKSLDSVDGPVAHAMSIGAWLEYNGDTTASFFKELLSNQKE
jgi:phage terminase large subunit-like protein